MTALRRLAALGVALPLAGGALVLTAPGAAAAVDQPVDGAVFTSYRAVDIQAGYGSSAGGTERLLLTSPGGAEVEVDAQPGGFGGGTLSHQLELGCWTADCRLAPNGTWTIRQVGSTNDTGTFVTSIAPDLPKDVRAAAVSPREVQLSWRLGAEPDLVGWDVYEGSAKVQAGVTRSACGGGVCSTIISYAAAGSGEHTYAVRALRSTAPGSASVLESPPSAPASARLEAAPAASSSPDGASTDGGATDSGSTPGGTSTGTAGGDAAGGSTGGSAGPARDGGTAAPLGSAPTASAADSAAVAQRKAFATGFSAFGPKLGIPKLPPLPQAQAPSVAPELADGTFEPTLGFEDQVVQEQVEVAQGPTRQVRNVVGSALDSERLATSTAGALLLLLAGAHLRRWLGSTAEEQ